MKYAWQVIHHAIAHPLLGLSFGRVWAWEFHDWTAALAWPDDKAEIPERYPGLE